MTVTIDAAPNSLSYFSSYFYPVDSDEVAYRYPRQYYNQGRNGQVASPVAYYYESAESMESEETYGRSRLMRSKDLTLRDIYARISAQPNRVY